ncbi:MAG: hypothetical protein FJ087_15585, partial [Deltaproteobacteria bacterium]|nr:hypothetical protein [Deltaproteobacteria bacterium]
MRTGRLVGNGGNGYGLGYGYGYGYGLGHGYGIGVGILLACVACGSGGGSADTGAADVADAADETPDAAEVAADPGITPPVPWGAKNRGFTAMRGIVHLHSLWSHDGCFGGADEKRPADDSPFMLQCLAELRAAPCLSGIDFVFQTDHPSNVKHRTFEEALHFQPANGDEILKDAAGRPLANRIKCPDGSLVPHALFYVGAEGKKNMPIGVV